MDVPGAADGHVDRAHIQGRFPLVSRSRSSRSFPIRGSRAYPRSDIAVVVSRHLLACSSAPLASPADISFELLQGRSVKDVIHWGFAGPALLCFIWLSVFGGAGIRMERQVPWSEDA